MRLPLRLLFAAALLGAPLLLSAVPAGAASPASGYLEVAAAGDAATPAVRTPRRARRAAAHAHRRTVTAEARQARATRQRAARQARRTRPQQPAASQG